MRLRDAWQDDMSAYLGTTVRQSGGCRSGRNTILWPDTVISFLHCTRRLRRSAFRLR